MDTIYNAEGCFYRALDDEPVFVILARDPCAAETVRWWVTLRQALIGRGEKPLEDHEKLADALSTAQAMTVWRSDATGPEWIDGPRWKVEEVPTRELVDCAEIARLQDRVRELEEIISTAQHQTVDAIKTCLDITSLVDLPPEEGRPDAILRKRLENYEDDHRVTISAGALRKVIRATPFVAVDLAAKVAMGLRQITTEYLATVAATTWPNARKDAMNKFADRINGFAAELEEGSIIGKSLQSRPIRVHPAMAEPYQPSDSPAKLANEIRDWVGDRDTERATTLLRIAERVRNLPEPDPYDAFAKGSPAAIISAIGRTTGTTFDPASGTMRRPEEMTQLERFHAGIALPGDTSEGLDITEVPDMPAHRFAVFDKSDGWAYGRGLEIAPSHIPAMLDRLEADGYMLVSIVGSQADKIGMMFRRVPPAKRSKAPDVAFLGTFEGHAVYVALQTPRHVRSCIASLLAEPCGAGGLGRGLEP